MRARTAEAPESGDRGQQHSYPYDAFLSYDHDDQPVAYGIQRGLRLWDAETGQPVGNPFTGHTSEVTTVAFSPDGHRLATGSADDDHTVRLWNADSGAQLGSAVAGFSESVASVAFDPDGRSFFAASHDGTLGIWPDIASPQVLCDKLTHNMSLGHWQTWVSSDIDYINICPGLPVAAG
jgi:WD40 repeat protein